MSVMFLLIGCSILIALAFLSLFLWSVNAGQYEDTCTPSMRMLLEDERPAAEPPAGDDNSHSAA